jgi:hypothetical protein
VACSADLGHPAAGIVDHVGHSARARGNRVFCTDKKRIRTENAVMDKNKDDLALLLSKIADCVRTAFRPRNTETLQQ